MAVQILIWLLVALLALVVIFFAALGAIVLGESVREVGERERGKEKDERGEA